MNNEPECILQIQNIVGEGPLWCPVENILYWVDILSCQIHQFDPCTLKHSCFAFDQFITCVAKREKGGIIAAMKNCFAFINLQECSYKVIETVEQKQPENRFNDGKCDRQGRLWAGTMSSIGWDQPLGSLYRLDHNLKVQKMEKNVVCSNGIGWSPDSKTMYFTESFRYAIFAYDFNPEKGTISNRRIFAEFDPNSGGFPDGLTVDADGYIWSAQCGIGKIIRYSPKGKIDDSIKIPVPRVTSCAFGGEDYSTLYITTARETMSEDQLAKSPLSGSLFACKLGVKGIPETPFIEI